MLNSARDITNSIKDMVSKGKISNHMLTNSARNHTGEAEYKELCLFKAFVVSKNGRSVFRLKGHE